MTPVQLLRALAVATAVGAWLVILIGGYVTTTNSGLGCQNVIDCGNAPINAQAAAIELTHRVAAWVEGFLVLALLIVVLWRYRAWRPVRDLTLLAFVLVAVQSTLGMASVYSGFEAYVWYPLLVTAHLGVATAFLAVSVLNARQILRGTPPTETPSLAGTTAPSPE